MAALASPACGCDEGVELALDASASPLVLTTFAMFPDGSSVSWFMAAEKAASLPAGYFAGFSFFSKNASGDSIAFSPFVQNRSCQAAATLGLSSQT